VKLSWAQTQINMMQFCSARKFIMMQSSGVVLHLQHDRLSNRCTFRSPLFVLQMIQRNQVDKIRRLDQRQDMECVDTQSVPSLVCCGHLYLVDRIYQMRTANSTQMSIFHKTSSSAAYTKCEQQMLLSWFQIASTFARSISSQRQ
jgi:hypothetical protein